MFAIKHIDSENLSDALALRVLPEQEKYVTPPAESLSMAYVYYDRSIPLGLYCGDKMVGYALILYDRDAAAYSLCHFCINAPEQRKGCGRAFLGKLLRYIAEKPLGEAENITVTCSEDNIAIMKLNREYGFEKTGAGDDVSIAMSLPISAVKASESLPDDTLDAVAGGVVLREEQAGFATASSRDSAAIRTGDDRGQLTAEQLSPEYIRRQIFGAKFDELYGN